MSMGTKSTSDLPRGRDLFRDAISQAQSIAIDSSVHILPERAWMFAEYGRDWALDLFAVTHNAMRIELRDLYGITVSFAKRKDTISDSDVENFFVWWPPFATFIVNALSLGDDVRRCLPTARVLEAPNGSSWNLLDGLIYVIDVADWLVCVAFSPPLAVDLPHFSAQGCHGGPRVFTTPHTANYRCQGTVRCNFGLRLEVSHHRVPRAAR